MTSGPHSDPASLNDPGRERLFLTDAAVWTGGLNDTLDADGQFPYR
ncbi:hypothetical protein GCM10027075_76390 [Streptomyces heilongjiangensis]